MQVDFHYYGVYALARLAGLNQNAAKIIATASQYVDDALGNDTLDHENGGKLIPVVTAHHTACVKNINRDDQRFIWVPFHFLPGNHGDAFTERLVCRKNSDMAKTMRDHHLNLFDKPFALELMGITAHVYADTFAHFGFSGVSSRRNRVKNDDIRLINVSKKARVFWDEEQLKFYRKYGTQGGLLKNIKRTLFSSGAELFSGALGHGAVLTYPDQPYLHWQFTYENKGESFPDRPTHEYDRKNQDCFLEACRELHDLFIRFGDLRPDCRDTEGPVVFNGDVENCIREILAFEEGKPKRSQAWNKAVKAGRLYSGEKIPPYDAKAWDDARDGFPGLKTTKETATYPVYRFYQAASLHQHYVLRELLPENGLVVV
jgi:hypothetical protein